MHTFNEYIVTNHSIDNGAAIWITSSVETNVGIIFTCMHSMKPVLSRIVPGFFSTSESRKHSDNSGRLRGLNKWINSPKESKGSSNATSDFSLHVHATTVELKQAQRGESIRSSHGNVHSNVVLGSVLPDLPTDKIMYSQEVEVVSKANV
jgi:hypothetical protein